MLESKLSVWIKVVVKGKGRDHQSTERDSVYDEEYRAENRALGNSTRGSLIGREFDIAFDMKGAR